jgi:hypothetical protein
MPGNKTHPAKEHFCYCCRVPTVARLLQEKYWEYEYDEVVSPNMYTLWQNVADVLDRQQDKYTTMPFFCLATRRTQRQDGLQTAPTVNDSVK